MRYSRHLFKFVIVLLLFSASVMFIQAYRTSQNEYEFHSRVLARAVDTTAREIALSIKSSQRALHIFAEQKRSRLARIVSFPSEGVDDTEIARQIALYFPDHLAFAISDTLAHAPMVSENSLFGQHCRHNLDEYASNSSTIALVPAIHDSGLVDSKHFDIMARIPDSQVSGKTIGIIFVSFRIKDLERLIKNGTPETHLLALEDAHGTSDQAGIAQFNVSAKGKSASVAADQSFKLSHSSEVEGTTWAINGWLNPETSSRVRNATIIQTAAGSIALIVAGLTAWRSIEQEKMSRNRTTIVLDSVEAERKRIARDLHDQVLADVNHTKRLLSEIDLNCNSDTATVVNIALIDQVHRNIDDFSFSIRTSIEDLHPHILENLGLSKAIEAYAQSRCHSGPTLVLQISNNIDASLNPDQQLQLYRIAVEVINNTICHSQCSDLHVSLSRDSHNLTLKIDDNGIGFDPKKNKKTDRFGISNIESRSASLDSRISWSNATLGGSCFKLTMPLRRHDIS